MALLAHAQKLVRLGLRAEGFRSLRCQTALADLHYYESTSSGPLPPTVLLHGIGSSATAFAAVLRRLRPRCSRLIAVDAPGHGFSSAPADVLSPETLLGSITELLDQRMDAPFVLVGNSLGGAMALRYALGHPERTMGVVACSPGGAGATAEEFAALRTHFHLSTREDALAFMDKLYHRKPWFSPLLAPDVKRLLMSGPVREFFDAASVDDLFSGDDLAALRAPLLVLWGGADRLLPREHLAFFRAHLPSHTVIEEPAHFGHSPQMEWPAEFADRVAAFAASLPRTTNG
jgi:pimeloyl-ACP methyl ester carboxylesterase